MQIASLREISAKTRAISCRKRCLLLHRASRQCQELSFLSNKQPHAVIFLPEELQRSRKTPKSPRFSAAMSPLAFSHYRSGAPCVAAAIKITEAAKNQPPKRCSGEQVNSDLFSKPPTGAGLSGNAVMERTPCSASPDGIIHTSRRCSRHFGAVQ